MKKMFLIFSLLMFLVSFSGLPVVSAEGQPGISNELTDPVLKNDLELLMRSIHEYVPGRKKKFTRIYSELQKKYGKRDFQALKIINLKYLFLTGNRADFMKQLSEFPDDFVFKNYLEVGNQQMLFSYPLQQKKDFTKTDLINLWNKIDEIDKKIDSILKNKDYNALFNVYIGAPESNVSPYRIFKDNDNYYWANFEQVVDFYCGEIYGNSEYNFLINKEDKIRKFIYKNLNTIVSNEKLFVKFMINSFSWDLDKDKLFLPFNTKLYSKQELEEINKAIERFQKKLIPPSLIYDFNQKRSISYTDQFYPEAFLDISKMAGPYVYMLDERLDSEKEIFIFDEASYKKFESQNIKDIKKYTINNQMFAIVYGIEHSTELILIFKKDKNGDYMPYAVDSIYRPTKEDLRNDGPC